jgi:hypothetical protein
MRYDRHRDEPGKIKKDLELGFAMGVGIKVSRAHAVRMKSSRLISIPGNTTNALRKEEQFRLAVLVAETISDLKSFCEGLF